MAMGIALLRIVDPKLSSKAMDDYAMAYLPIAPTRDLIDHLRPHPFRKRIGSLVAISLLGPFPTDLATGVEDDGGLLALDTIYRVLVRRFPVLETHGQ